MRRNCEEKFKPIPLGEGRSALVSEADFEELSAFEWMPFEAGRNIRIRENPMGDFLGTYVPREHPKRKINPKIYAVQYYSGAKPRRPSYMHDMLVSRIKGEQVIFLDGNTLNNCRSNLLTTGEYRELLAERAEAFKERRRAKYRGVQEITYYKPSKWQASMMWAETRYYLGQFDDPESAARAYDAMAITLGRDASVLNFPEEHPGYDPQITDIEIAKNVRGKGVRTRMLSRAHNTVIDQLEGVLKSVNTPPSVPITKTLRRRFVVRPSSPTPESGPVVVEQPDPLAMHNSLLDLMEDFGL